MSSSWGASFWRSLDNGIQALPRKRTKQDVNNGHKRRVMMTKMISLMIIWIKGLSPHCYAENFCTACNDGNSEEQTREWHLNHPLSKERFLPQCQDSINLWFFTLALPGLPTKLPTSDRRHVSVQLRFSTSNPPWPPSSSSSTHVGHTKLTQTWFSTCLAKMEERRRSMLL